MQVHVVYDLGGAGRLVGVFTDREHAEKIVAVNPAYYRVIDCDLNEVSDSALDWLRSLQGREKVEELRRASDD
ncbi:MAG: hypothetical protein JO263_06850 [Candidatus Eremiobacteraeota bacterium]|nr:hypothetical protein [Candidatus Eremiobacteraeota bacterium]